MHIESDLCPIPDVIYPAPELWDSEDYVMPPDQDKLDMSKGQCVFCSCVLCSQDIIDLCMIPVGNWAHSSPVEALWKLLI